MTKREKRIELWRRGVTDENPDTVFAELKARGFISRSVNGSHHIFDHKTLKKAYSDNPEKLRDYGPSGFITIPVKGGQRVKGVYLKMVVKACDIIDEYERTHPEW